MARPRHPSDDAWNEKRSPAAFRVHTSIQNHPKMIEVFPSNDLLACWVRLGCLARDRGATETEDRIHLSRADVERTSGKRRADVAATLLQRLANLLNWTVERQPNVTVIHFRNFGKKQGFTPRKSRTRPQDPRKDSAQTPHSPSFPLSASSSPDSYESGAGRLANGTADPVKALFDAGVNLLAVNGDRGPARSFVGKLRKVHGDEEAMRLIVEARGKTDPREWLAATLVDPSTLPYCPGGRRE